MDSKFYDINGNEIAKTAYDSLEGFAKIIKVVGGVTRYSVEVFVEHPNTESKIQQARHYLLATDFKAVNGTLTPEQEAKRAKAKIVLDGSFVEPPSDLFDT